MADKIRKKLVSVVMAVKSRVHDAILLAMDNVVVMRAEMAVRSIAELSGREPNGMVQLLNQRHFFREYKKTPLMLVSGRVDLSIDQDRNDDIRNVENLQDAHLPVLRTNYGRQAQILHSASPKIYSRNFTSFLLMS